MSGVVIVTRPLRDEEGSLHMLYALLCYNSEEMVFSWSKEEEDDAVMAKLHKVHERLAVQNKLGPSLRLMPTTAATTLRKSDPPLVIDGPYAETKEQLLGFYVIDCDDPGGSAGRCASDLGAANPGGAYEIRPLRLFLPGTLPAEALAAEALASESTETVPA